MSLTLMMLLTACVPKSQVRALVAQNDALQMQLALSEAKLVQAEAALGQCSQALSSAGRAPGPSAVEEEEAMQLYNALNTAVGEGRVDEARQLLDELLRDYPDTRIASRAVRLKQELDVIGLPAPVLEVDEWWQQERAGWGRVTVVIFFEVWCPHCRREVPALQSHYAELAPRGLEVMALTRLTKSSTWESTQEFIDEQGLSYPIGKENGSMAEYFKVSGIPAAAVIQDGEIVWRGHPGRLDWGWVEGLL
ncbi:MAG: TlpA family protein disulfide reductase [Alphaproteobacteria bacterium]|nr:TlpA family protein disulfide reductase [Alphaproteobacteria bacterium]MCB9791982.1 TlpA family protein disulfide reductase [Alphaproteobacteria bacterium]